MLNLLKNLFSTPSNYKKSINEFNNLKKNTNIIKIFKSIESYSKESEIRYVGGCVRKILTQEKIDDVDLATNLKPQDVIKVLKKNNINYYETGIDHGTVTAIIENEKYEITSLRSDIFTDGRHAKVEFTNDWFKDAQRRDFTINAIYADLNGNLFDPFNGVKDLRSGKIVFVGDAEKRIREDYLRILRYIRFFLKYSKSEHENNVIKSINKNINGISKISPNRLLDEFKKIIQSVGLIKLISDQFSYETIKLIFPQFKNLDNFKKINHTLFSRIENIDFAFLLSMLVIDETDNSEYFIYKFNISKKDQKRITNLKRFFYTNEKIVKYDQKNLWKILYLYGKETLIDILNYKILISKKIDNNLEGYIKFFGDKEAPILPINGEQLIKKFNVPEGKEVGKNLKLIENMWLENNFKISEDQVKKLLQN